MDEETLRKSAAIANQAILNSLPSPDTCQHEFSPSFEKKMYLIIRKTRHPLLYKLPKLIACFFLIFFLLSCTFLTVNAHARTVFFSWIRETYHSWVGYHFVRDIQESSQSNEYELTWLPLGYSKLDYYELASSTVTLYTDQSGHLIQFSYAKGEDATSLFVQPDCAKLNTITLGNIQADFYEAHDPEHASVLVWRSENNEYLFCISAFEPKDTIVQMAESMVKK